MSKFKVGDLVVVVCGELAEFYNGIAYVEHVSSDLFSGIDALLLEPSRILNSSKGIGPYHYREERFEKLKTNINDINKLLYPDYVEYKGYLISKEAHETLTHKKK